MNQVNLDCGLRIAGSGIGRIYFGAFSFLFLFSLIEIGISLEDRSRRQGRL